MNRQRRKRLGGSPLADDRRRHSHPTGRPGQDHPDTAAQERQEVARLRQADRAHQAREEGDDRRIESAPVADDGLDHRDRADEELAAMVAAERMQPHPNDWAS